MPLLPHTGLKSRVHLISHITSFSMLKSSVSTSLVEGVVSKILFSKSISELGSTKALESFSVGFKISSLNGTIGRRKNRIV